MSKVQHVNDLEKIQNCVLGGASCRPQKGDSGKDKIGFMWQQFPERQTFSASTSVGFGLNNSSRPSACEYFGFLIFTQFGDGLSVAFYEVAAMQQAVADRT